jgi:hypothetical protein
MAGRHTRGGVSGAARARRSDGPGAPLTALGALPRELQTAGVAAAALAASLVLPWYEKSFFATGPGRRPLAASDNLSAFGVFSFVEAAVLLVAAGVLYLVWARAQRKGFHLPGGDGFVISLAGAWAGLLLVWRLFDKPDIDEPAATIGIQWGFFGAMVAAAALIAAGARVRAAHRPEPPNPAEEVAWETAPRRADRGGDRPPRDATAVTEVLGDRPEWEGEPPDAPAPRDRAQPPPGDDPPPRSPDRLF